MRSINPSPRPRSIRRRNLPASIVSSLLLCFGLAALGQANGSIRGRISPVHDHDFVLSSARIPDLALHVDVEGDGSFHFENVRPGTYLIEVRVPSLGVVTKRVQVRPGEATEVEMVLIPGSHSEEIVVTASADARDPDELATASTSLSGQELALRLESSLGETLSGEAGVSSSFFGPGASRPIIRGLAGDRVRMLEGGIGTGDASGVSADHAVTTDPSQAERIEVIRGPGTLLYGSSAIGGVVNVIDERIPTVRAISGIHGAVDLRGGTGNDERQGAIDLTGGSGSWAWRVHATTRETGDYEIPGFARIEDPEHTDGEESADEENPFGTVPNTDLETRGARAGVTHFFDDKGFLGVSVSGFDTEYGLPGGLGHGEEETEGEGAADEEHEEGVPVRIDMEQRRFDLRGQINQPFQGFTALEIRLGLTDYEHVELEGNEEGTLFFNDFFETRLQLIQAKRGRHSGAIGLQFSDRDLEAVGAEAFLPPTATERWALFTLQELETGSVRWQFGARFENQSNDPTSTVVSSRSHSGFSTSAGLVWQASEHVSLAGSLARATKLPAAEELFSNGLHAATQTFEVGNPDLQEETGLGLDLSLRLETKGFSAELTWFRQDFDNFIFQAFTGAEDEGFPVVLYSQEDARFSGVELEARVELLERESHHLHLSLVGDLVDAELDSGNDLPRIPPKRLGAGLHYHSEHWNASTELRWVDQQNDLAINETPTDGYTLVNASLGYRLLLRNQIVDILLRGRNLTDEEARTHTSFLKDVAPLPGRNITLALKFQF